MIKNDMPMTFTKTSQPVVEAELCRLARNDAHYWRDIIHITDPTEAQTKIRSVISTDTLCMRLPPELWPAKNDWVTKTRCLKLYLLEFRKAFDQGE
jgi:hypothetical protein